MFLSIKIHFVGDKLIVLDLFALFFKYFLSSVIFQIPMIALEKLHQNLSDNNQFLFKRDLKLTKTDLLQ